MTRIVASILSYNSIETLLHTLETVDAQTVQPDRVVVVDNGSRDGTVDELRASWPAVEIVALGQNLGVGAGHNAGWRVALDDPTVDAIWALEHDSWPADTCLARLLETWRDREHRGPPVGAVHPRQIVRGKTPSMHAAATAPSASRFLHLNGALLPAAALHAVGLLREDFFVSHEDRELGWRLAAAGWQTIRDGGAFVVHRNYADARHTRRTVARRYYGWRNDAYLRINVFHERQAMLNVLGGTGVTLVRVLRRGPSRSAYVRARVRATIDAFRGNLGRKDYAFLRSE